MSALLELAERVEALTKPSAQLDEEIRAAVFCKENIAGVRQSHINGAWCIFVVGYGGKERLWEPRNLSQEQRRGAFTASIDAAMTLLPEGHRLSHLGEARYMTRSPAFFAQLEVWTSTDGVDGSERRAIGVAATPALALVPACLRALAQVEQGQ